MMNLLKAHKDLKNNKTKALVLKQGSLGGFNI